MAFKCYPISDPNSVWEYCPSFAAAIVYTIFFALATLAHGTQAFMWRKPFCAVLVMGAAWETAGYIFRIISITNQLSSGLYTAQLLLILLAPLWINAFVYMVLGRMIHFQMYPVDKIYHLKARKITLIFVLCDIATFFVQVIGGVMTNNDNSYSTQENGLHIYMGGVGLQIFFIAVFISIGARFHYLLRRQRSQSPAGQVNELRNASAIERQLIVLYIVIGLIIFRNVYRLIEFSAGANSSITEHEWYTYVFDATPMLLCFVLFAVLHPGKVLQGERCDFTEENRELKAAKRQRKEEKKARKHQNYKMEKPRGDEENQRR